MFREDGYPSAMPDYLICFETLRIFFLFIEEVFFLADLCGLVKISKDKRRRRREKLQFH